eukprot:TRINITY_DN1791_c0_g1_i1.p1 TRINITY_DN1791_c0_g1~~TRINITY_DN1791_c0_g1_i1.p1  ORF type:complete len:150 (+),score=28.63 TRINITY_DN1791_c0_g1_i1:30-452(+)
MATILLLGLGVAGLAVGARYGMQAYRAARTRISSNQAAQAAAAAAAGATGDAKSAASSFTSGFLKKKFYEGGFQPVMTRAEAALILGVRISTPKDKIKLAHRRIMLSNHPDNGGSDYVASKVNEAKDLLLSEDDDTKPGH